MTVDVRPILKAGGEPFAEIMTAVASLAPGQTLRLLATFKPVPLFGVMGGKGFDHQEREIGGGDWEVVFTPKAAQASTSRPVTQAKGAGATLDTRGLEPPEPMVRVLAAVEAMAPGAVLEVFTEREPVFLYQELAARGVSIRSEWLGTGGYRHVICVAGPAGEAA
jgi:TusA-related sulfurtransferase